MAEHYQIKFLNNSNETLTPQELADVIQQTDTLKHIRGNFLDYVLENELVIQIIIENYMLHKKSKLKGVFRTNILNKASLNKKIEILLAIINEKKALSSKDLKSLKS